jgi:hypothetical protein
MFRQTLYIASAVFCVKDSGTKFVFAGIVIVSNSSSECNIISHFYSFMDFLCYDMLSDF